MRIAITKLYLYSDNCKCSVYVGVHVCGLDELPGSSSSSLQIASVNDAVERLWSIITVALIDDYRAMGV